MHTDAANIGANSKYKHPCKLASSGLFCDSADVGQKASTSFGRNGEPDERNKDGRNDAEARDHEEDPVALRFDPHEREIQNCKDDERHKSPVAMVPLANGVSRLANDGAIAVRRVRTHCAPQ
jgi:hypothetical protein